MCITGVGCIVGAPAIAAGTGLIVHGGTKATAGAVGVGQQLGQVYNAMTGGNKKKSQHVQDRGSQERRTNTAFGDAQRARKSDVYTQPDGRYVVRGRNGREHIFELDGELVTVSITVLIGYIKIW